MPAPKKSLNAPDTGAMFEQLAAELRKYAPPFSSRTGGVRDKSDLSLFIDRTVEIDGRTYPELMFAAVIQQKAYVGFYFMPVYMAPEEMKAVLSPQLLKLLKGKSCFQIKSLDAALLADIRTALAAGHRLYKSRGWL